MWYRKAEGSDPNSNSHFNHRHTLQNISLVNVFPVQCLLVITIKSSMFLSIQLFLADVYIGKIDINVQKTQYNIFNRMLCMQTVHVTACKLYMLQHTNCTCCSMQTVHVTAYKTVHVTAYKLYILQHTKQQSAKSRINCPVIRKQCFKHFASQHDRNYIEVFYCVLVMLQEIGWGFWVDITHYKFSHLK
jgi:hypothetical protein